MDELKVTSLLTPEVLEAITKNADALMSLLSFDEELDRREHGKDRDDCCCPKIIKYNFFFSHVDIKNDNAECKDKKHHKC